jgi:hypothetical protein
MPTMTLPYDERHTHHCPFCNSLDTEYHPAQRWGRCHSPGCGRDWNLTRPEPNHMQTPRDFDLIDDAMMAQRIGRPYREAFAAYAKMKVPGVTLERFDRAWKRAKELA